MSDDGVFNEPNTLVAEDNMASFQTNLMEVSELTRGLDCSSVLFSERATHDYPFNR